MTSTRQVRANGPAQLPKWLVTAPHGVWQVIAGERSWVPFGVRHAREVGGTLTACKQFAVGWQLFWDLPFLAAEGGVCQECAEEILRDPGGWTPRREGSSA